LEFMFSDPVNRTSTLKVALQLGLTKTFKLGYKVVNNF